MIKNSLSRNFRYVRNIPNYLEKVFILGQILIFNQWQKEMGVNLCNKIREHMLDLVEIEAETVIFLDIWGDVFSQLNL